MRDTLRFGFAGLLVTLAFVAACASAGGGAHPGGCPVAGVDTVFLQRGAAFHDCDVTTKAKQSNPNFHPDFTPTHQGCVSAELEFVVDVNGRPETETARIVRSNDQEFAAALLASLPQWRYEPAQRNGTAVRQIVDERRMAISSRQADVLIPRGSAAVPPAMPPTAPTC